MYTEMLSAATALALSRSSKSTSPAACLSVLKYIQTRIATAATLGQQDTLVYVPLYIPDCPEFRLHEMTEYIVYQLTISGFYLYPLSSGAIYVSWRYPIDKSKT